MSRAGLRTPGPVALTRAAAVAVLALVLAAVAAALFAGGEDEQTLRIRLGNASQLVKGNEIKVGGLAIGTVDAIRLTDDNQAEVEVTVADDDLVPLHEGTRAWVRQSSLSGVANRYIALEPGANSNPVLGDDAVIRATDTQPVVELDAVISTMDAETREDFQRFFRGNAQLYRDREQDLNRGLAVIEPAVAQLEATFGELNRDRAAFEQFIVAGAGWVSAVADRAPDLEGGLGAAATTARAFADERVALDRLLRNAPASLRQTAGTLRRARGTLDALAPAAREAVPVAPRLARFLGDLDPVLDALPGTLRDTRRLLPVASAWLNSAPSLRDAALPAFASATTALARFQPILRGLREYGPDVILGATNGFGGTAAGPYDANGAYGRIGAVAGTFSTAGVLAQLPAETEGGYRPLNLFRCAGAATQLHPDGSNQVRDQSVPCKTEQRP